MRSFKKLATVLMLLSFIFATVSPVFAAGLANVASIAGGNGGGTNAASTVYFGNYWQTLKGTATSGSTNLSDYNKEGIKWRVLANNTTADANGNKGLLLLSDQALYADQFNEITGDGSGSFMPGVPGVDPYSYGHDKNISEADANKWETSDVRKTLNNRTGSGFAKDAFSDKEYAAIADTTHTAGGGSNNGSGISSADRIFLLSYEEVNNTAYGFEPYDFLVSPKSITRKASVTEMAQNVTMYGNGEAVKASSVDSTGSSKWWLRSPGQFSYQAQNVYYSDPCDLYNSDVGVPDNKFTLNENIGNYAVRAALNLDQDTVLFASAAEGGKGAVDIDDGFALDNTYDGSNGWKLTLKDATIATPNVTKTEIAGSKKWDVNDLAETAKSGTKIIEISDQTPTGSVELQIAYDDAATGTNMYVSALLKDGSGNYVNYAKVSQDAAGTKTIDVSGITPANYTLCIYGEQENGDYQTDYASALSEHAITISETVNKILSSDYAAEGLTAKISNGLELGFESGEYDTAVTIEDGKSGKITADATDGTTLTGAVTVGNGAMLTTANSFTLKGDNTVDGAVTGDALTIAGGKTTVSSTGSIANALTISTGGTLELNADKYGVTGGVENPALDGGTLSLTGGTLTKAVTGGNLNVNGDVTSKADYIAGDTNTVTSGNILTLSAGTLAKEITGEGTTKITGDVTADAAIATALTVDTTGELTASADNLGGETTNKGTVTLTDGTLAKAISGEGTTKIAGDVTADAAIATALTVNTAGELTAAADSLKNDVTNSGIVNFTGGTLAGNYTSTGTTNVKGKTAFSGEVSLANSTVNFYFDGFKAGDTIVISDKPAALDNAEIGLYQVIDTEHKLTQKGDKITLISSAEGYGYTEEAPNLIDVQGGMVEDTYGVYQSATGALEAAYIESGLIDQTKSFSEARLAGLAAINSGSDLIATEVMEDVEEFEKTKDWKAFAAIKGSHNRYETGSHIDLNSTNVAAGLSKKVKDNVTLGLFVEGGNGRYTTENEFEDGNVRADGDINYFGGGVFFKAEGKKTAKGQLHGEASFRAGHMNSDYNSETFDEGKQTRFDTSEAYMGAHAGLGYKWALKDNSNIDTYVKYLWNRQNSDTPTIAGEQFDLDAINSHRLRAGFRYNGKENENGVKFFGGLAYEYEFDGTAKGHMGEYALLEPDFKGGSGMAELGIKYHKPNSPWKVELGLTGYTGKRDSIGANLNAWYEFGEIRQR